ncbi:D-amino acid oxidase [Burkholderia sp. Leaf177]|uniref:NAD(P)/FAD-dependent oxidoreductase n=1 Tax=Burkholderia sp. Leaf177 TaxID=1736287 RepID=UPI0006F88EE7|nr:FAD-binding oxidoreductase [Burkholderia sp. Leaf177]KQR77256.1 D-amino acid oxidase [Burkholderia sp. Leaf177]
MLRVNEVADSDGFPDNVDVAIIGGGIVGVAAAYELARFGVSVALFEKGYIGAEQSSRNWGFVRQQNRDLLELPLAMRSLRRWGELSDEIGFDLGFRRTGILYGSDNPTEIEKWEEWGRAARQQGFVSHMLSASEIREISGVQHPNFKAGVWSPDDGRAEPSMAAPAIAEGAKKFGANIYQTCAVRGFDISAGRISGVVTERGLVRSSTVICAGGAWSSRLCRQYGIALPSANIVGSAMRTSVAPEVTNGCLSAGNFAMRRRIDGAYTLAVPGHGRMELTPQGLGYAAKFYEVYRSKVAKKLKIRIGKSFFNGPEAAGTWSLDDISPFEKQRVLNPSPDHEWAAIALRRVISAYPVLSQVRVVQMWAGLIDTTPDLFPVISTVDQLPGLVIASGFSGHGFATGPGAGQLIAEMVTNRQPFTDISDYRLSRFSDGSATKRPEMM